jgi:hypothetical protein
MVIFQNFKPKLLKVVHTLFGSFFPIFTLLLLSFQGTLFTTLKMEELSSMKINGPSQKHAELVKWPDVHTFHFHLQISITYVHPTLEHNLTLFRAPP